MIYVLSSIFVIGILIFIHELGHFAVAKLFGVKVKAFSLGFGKPILHKKIGDTDYRLSIIPLGGYVKMEGETDFGKDVSEMSEDSFLKKSPLIRLAVIFAGPFMNFVLAYLVFVILLSVYGEEKISETKIGKVDKTAYEAGFRKNDRLLEINGNDVVYFDDIEKYITSTDTKIDFSVLRGDSIVNIEYKVQENKTLGIYPYIKPEIGTVLPSTPAKQFGLKKGDTIVKINSDSVNSWYEMSDVFKNLPDTIVDIVIKRDGQLIEKRIKTTSISAEKNGESKRLGMIGVNGEMETVRERIPFFESVDLAFNMTVNSTTLLVDFLGKLITGKESAKNLGGPIMIFRLSGETAKMGFDRLLSLLALLSVNLGLLNLLPLPVLDGGFIVIYGVEAVTRQRINMKYLIALQYIGFILLLLLTIFVTFNDIMRLAGKG